MPLVEISGIQDLKYPGDYNYPKDESEIIKEENKKDSKKKQLYLNLIYLKVFIISLIDGLINI